MGWWRLQLASTMSGRSPLGPSFGRRHPLNGDSPSTTSDGSGLAWPRGEASWTGSVLGPDAVPASGADLLRYSDAILLSTQFTMAALERKSSAERAGTAG